MTNQTSTDLFIIARDEANAQYDKLLQMIDESYDVSLVRVQTEVATLAQTRFRDSLEYLKYAKEK